jgi:hypothetical protein
VAKANVTVHIKGRDELTPVFKKVGANLDNFARKLRSGFSGAIGNVGLVVGGYGIARAVKSSIDAASTAAESASKFGSVFADQTEQAARFISRLAESVGRSRVEMLDSMSSFQGFFKGLGAGGERARALSEKLQTLAIDFGSFHNLSDDEASSRFISALSGSAEVLDRFGVNLRVAALDQALLAKGIVGGARGASELEKSIARVAIITRAMGDQGALGDAVRTASSYANQLKRLKGGFADLNVEIGRNFIPIAQSLVSTLSKNMSSIGAGLQNITIGALGVGQAAFDMGRDFASVFQQISGFLFDFSGSWKSEWEEIAISTKHIWRGLQAEAAGLLGKGACTMERAVRGHGFFGRIVDAVGRGMVATDMVGFGGVGGSDPVVNKWAESLQRSFEGGNISQGFKDVSDGIIKNISRQMARDLQKPEFKIVGGPGSSSGGGGGLPSLPSLVNKALGGGGTGTLSPVVSSTLRGAPGAAAGDIMKKQLKTADDSKGILKKMLTEQVKATRYLDRMQKRADQFQTGLVFGA